MTTEAAVIEKPQKPRPEPDFYELLMWAEVNRIGENTAYEYVRRTIDPMPHIKQGNRYLVEVKPAHEWMIRKFGVGYPTEGGEV